MDYAAFTDDDPPGRLGPTAGAAHAGAAHRAHQRPRRACAGRRSTRSRTTSRGAPRAQEVEVVSTSTPTGTTRASRPRRGGADPRLAADPHHAAQTPATRPGSRSSRGSSRSTTSSSSARCCRRSATTSAGRTASRRASRRWSASAPFLVALTVGPLMERLGRRVALIFTTAGAAISSGLTGLAPSAIGAPWLVASRSASGLGYSEQAVNSTYLNELYASVDGRRPASPTAASSTRWCRAAGRSACCSRRS